MTPTHRTPDGRLWTQFEHKGQTHADLWGVVGVKRLLTTDLTNMEPIVKSLLQQIETLAMQAHKQALDELVLDRHNPQLEEVASAIATLVDAATNAVQAAERKE